MHKSSDLSERPQQRMYPPQPEEIPLDEAMGFKHVPKGATAQRRHGLWVSVGTLLHILSAENGREQRRCRRWR